MYEIMKKELPLNGCCTISFFPTGGKRPCVIFIHGFASDSDEVGDTFLQIRERLLKINYVCVSIDLPGFYNDMSSISDIDFDSLISSVEDVYDFIASSVEQIDLNNISICAFSMGCVIAAVTHKVLTKQPRKIVFISPTLNLVKDFSKVLGEQLIAQALSMHDTEKLGITFFSKGKEVIKHMRVKFFKQLLKYKPLDSLEEFTGDFYCVAGRNDFSHRNLKDYMLHVPRAIRKQSAELEDADHIFNAFSANSQISIVVNKSYNWLTQ